MATSVLQAPGFQRRKVGDVIVTALNDGFIILPPATLPDCDQRLSVAMGWRLPGFTRIGRSADAFVHHQEVYQYDLLA